MKNKNINKSKYLYKIVSILIITLVLLQFVYAKNSPPVDALPLPIESNTESVASISEAITDDTIFEHDGVKYKKSVFVGNFKLTGYCACKKCTLGTGITYSGKPVRANHTVAADLKVLPLNTFIILEGTQGKNVEVYNGVYQVEDKGGGVKNKHIDIYQPTHDLASLVTAHGYSFANIYIAEPIDEESNN